MLKTPCFAKRVIQCKAVQATMNNLFLNHLGDTRQISQSSVKSIIHQIHTDASLYWHAYSPTFKISQDTHKYNK